MRATVQYNAVIGTAAADVADRYSNSLQCSYPAKRHRKFMYVRTIYGMYGIEENV